jgi:hypothetical protein
MYRKKSSISKNEEYKKLKLDEEAVLKTPITTPFRLPIPGLQNSGFFFILKRKIKFIFQTIPAIQLR